ncbi:hypothetical protein [Janibacter terrae]|uniref:hypothetical protein n=1 Tax=Janibacter terrae TaxID=103817 RepID=UPI0008391C43|nr:hypothetical protein [Janibacter terrae]
MTLHNFAAAAAGLAAETRPDAPDVLNTAAIWGIVVFVAGLLAAFLGLSLMGKSKKGDLSGAAKSSGVAGIGLIWVLLGVGGLATGIVLSALNFFFNK